MEEFSIAWDWARYNVFYFLSYLIPLSFGILCVITKDRRGKYLYPFCSVILTFWVSGEAIIYKWHLRSIAAKAPDQKAIVAKYDGANIAFAPIIEAFNTVVLTGVFYLIILFSHKFICRVLNDRQALIIKDRNLKSKLTEMNQSEYANT